MFIRFGSLLAGREDEPETPPHKRLRRGAALLPATSAQLVKISFYQLQPARVPKGARAGNGRGPGSPVSKRLPCEEKRVESEGGGGGSWTCRQPAPGG